MSDVNRDEAVQATIAGEMFVYSNLVSALAAGATQHTAIRIGAAPLLVERRSYGTTASSITVNFYENTPANAGGTSITGTNRNRTPGGLLMPEPQTVRYGVTPSGALPPPLFTLNFLDTNKVSASFGDPNTDKIELAAGMDYLFSVTNNDAQARDFSWSWLVRRIAR